MNTNILSTLTHDAIGKCRESFSPHFTAPYGDLHSIFLELKFILQFMNGFYRPDSVGVFFDRAVSREESRVCDIHKRHLIKRLFVKVSVVDAFLRFNVTVKVGKAHIRIGDTAVSENKVVGNRVELNVADAATHTVDNAFDARRSLCCKGHAPHQTTFRK